MPYFNHRVIAIDAATASYGERRAFLNAWWSLYGDDSRWTPPEFNRLRGAVNPRHNNHLSRLEASLIHVEALYRTGLRRGRTGQQEVPLTSVLEKPLATATAIVDSRRRDRTAHLALLHLANDEETFDTLYSHLVETLSAADCRRMIGPVGLSSHLEAGALVDNWAEWPPQWTLGNPPYLPDLMERRFRPFRTGRLYHATVPAALPDLEPGPVSLRSFDVLSLAEELLPLLASAVENSSAGFPQPDADEASWILGQLGPPTLVGGLALVEETPVGFVLLGPDGAGRLRASRGGKPLWGRVRLAFTRHRPVASGRVYFAAVLPPWRGQGIGRKLWQWAFRAARFQGWVRLAIGPVWSQPGGPTAAEAFLSRYGAAPRQTYYLYERSF
jgi:GNAT superfamily N-acetyltransferase